MEEWENIQMGEDGLHLDESFREKLEEVVERYRARGLTLAQAVGHLQLVAWNLWEEIKAPKEEQQEEDDDDDNP